MLFRSSAAVLLAAAIGCASGGLIAVDRASAATEQSMQLIEAGSEWLGTPYRMGAAFKNGVPVAFDCSSFTQHLFRSFDIKLPRTAKSQSYIGQKVDRGSLSQGDLVFFRTSGRTISHVGVYAGDGMMLHASSSKGITLTDMNSAYWKKRYVTARRVL